MEHKNAFKKLGTFFDEECKENDRIEMEVHIKECIICSKELEIIRHQYMVLKKYSDIEPSPYFASKLQEKLNMPIKTGFNIGRFIPVPIALSILIFIFSLYMITTPLLFAMGIDTLKGNAKNMAKDLIACCMAGNAFAPAAFAELCDKCNMNICICCSEHCKINCKMEGEKNGK